MQSTYFPYAYFLQTISDHLKAKPVYLAMNNKDQLTLWIQQHAVVMQILQTLYEVDPTAYIAAGVIRNGIWSFLHGQDYLLDGAEVDVIFYLEHDQQVQAAKIQQYMQQRLPNMQWDVTNQAVVHHWYRLDNGESIQPLKSIEHALSLWPETATAVAVKLNAEQDIEIVAPFGLNDLFELKLRWNPRLVSLTVFEQRVVSKQWMQRWPKLSLVDANVEK